MPHTILIVDDSFAIRLKIRKSFEEADFVVIEANDGKIAIDIVSNRFDIDVIITDINMDDMDGFTMISRMRSLPHLINIPIFILSTEKSDESNARAKALGVYAWMVKPWNANKVVPHITNLLNSK